MEIIKGMRLLVRKGENTNGSVRENVTGVVVGCRGLVVVIDRDEPGRFAGEGVWAFTSDVEVI